MKTSTQSDPAVSAVVSPVGFDSPDGARGDVSALVDGELDDAGIDRAIDALLASDALAAFWADAHRAGDWMRSDEVVDGADGDAFVRRVSARLADEPTILAPQPARDSARAAERALATIATRRFWLRTGLPGASIAAAFAAVAWVATPAMRDGATDRIASGGTGQTVAVRKVDVDRLSDYFAAHRDVTPFGYRGAAARTASFTTAAGTTTTP